MGKSSVPDFHSFFYYPTFFYRFTTFLLIQKNRIGYEFYN